MKIKISSNDMPDQINYFEAQLQLKEKERTVTEQQNQMAQNSSPLMPTFPSLTIGYFTS